MNRLIDRMNRNTGRFVLTIVLTAVSASAEAIKALPPPPPPISSSVVGNSCLNTATSATNFQVYTCGCVAYTVPAGKVFVLESVSGFLGTAGNPSIAYVHAIAIGNNEIFFPVVPSVAPQDYVFFAPAKAYFTEGQQVSIEATVQPKTVGESCLLNGRVTGYLVDN